MKPVTPQSTFRGVALLLLGRIPSRLLGLTREILSASFFGAGRMMDAFNLSFTVVTSMRQLFAEQLITPIVPTYFQQKQKYGEAKALRSLRSITTRLTVIALVISALIFWGAEPIIKFIAPGFDPSQVNLSTVMLRWFAVGGIAIIMHRYFIGLHTCFFRYTAIAFSPLLFNLLAISAMVFFAVRVGVISLAAGISLGFIAYYISLMLTLPHRNKLLKPLWSRGDPGVSTYWMMLFPLFLAVSFEQLQLFIDRALASGLPEGALSAQGYALRLVKMVSDLLIGTFGTVIFPVFAALAQGNKKEEFTRNFSLSLQTVILALCLVGAIIISLALPIIRVILERGSFTFQDSVLTSHLMIFYTFAFSAQAVLIIIVRGFHAHGNTKTPTLTTLISASVMITLDFILIGPMGIYGLALATAIGYSLNMTLVFFLFIPYLTPKSTLQNLKILLLGLSLAGLTVWALDASWALLETRHYVESFFPRITALILLTAVAAIGFISILYLLRIPALGYIVNRFQQKKPTPISPEFHED